MSFNSEPPPPDTLRFSRQSDSPIDRHDIVYNSELEDTASMGQSLLHDLETRDERVENNLSNAVSEKVPVATATMGTNSRQAYMSHNRKLIRVFVFLAIEIAWLVFGLICYLTVIKAPLPSLDIFGLRTSGDTFFRAILTSSTHRSSSTNHTY